VFGQVFPFPAPFLTCQRLLPPAADLFTHIFPHLFKARWLEISHLFVHQKNTPGSLTHTLNYFKHQVDFAEIFEFDAFGTVFCEAGALKHFFLIGFGSNSSAKLYILK
jgi:hypothetical protein